MVAVSLRPVEIQLLDNVTGSFSSTGTPWPGGMMHVSTTMATGNVSLDILAPDGVWVSLLSFVNIPGSGEQTPDFVRAGTIRANASPTAVNLSVWVFLDPNTSFT